MTHPTTQDLEEYTVSMSESPIPDCTTCGDEHYIETIPDPWYPWITVEKPCPDCQPKED